MRKSLVEIHFDVIAGNYDKGKKKYSYYYENLKKLLSSVIPSGKKVFEVGCGTGDLLASLKPISGYGMDISTQMVQIAKHKYKKSKQLKFSTTWPSNRFGYIFMSDVIEHLEKPKETFRKIVTLMDKDSLFVITMENPIWEPLLMFWERMGWKMKEGPHRRLEYKELKVMLESLGLKIIKHDYKLLVPINIPIVSNYVNGSLEKLFKKYAFIEYVVTSRR